VLIESVALPQIDSTLPAYYRNDYLAVASQQRSGQSDSIASLDHIRTIFTLAFGKMEYFDPVKCGICEEFFTPYEGYPIFTICKNVDLRGSIEHSKYKIEKV